MKNSFEWAADHKSKALSILVAVSYVVFIPFFQYGSNLIALGLSLGMLCIWCGDVWGKAKGFNIRFSYITEETPGFFMVLIGWVLLLLPYFIEFFHRWGLFE